ncbi:hypothetical protein EJ110_NYTH49696 [Nymphaea thermarum]|nr:hypothetical protein EJ110_NYTH49696 [Nymphaea thermarum]
MTRASSSSDACTWELSKKKALLIPEITYLMVSSLSSGIPRRPILSPSRIVSVLGLLPGPNPANDALIWHVNSVYMGSKQVFDLQEDLTRLNEVHCKYNHHEGKRKKHRPHKNHEGNEKEIAYGLHKDNKGQEDQIDGDGKFQKTNASHLGRHEFLWFNNIRTWLSTQGYVRSMLRKHVPHQETWLNMHYVKAWLGGASISTLSEEYKEKKKDGLRVQRAEVHAALAVAGVAAAILGFAANSTSGWDPALVSAASLVAAVCAETAEALGADGASVSSVVNSAILACSPNEILTLTASAATCLRGAATLQCRVHSEKGLCTQQCARPDPKQQSGSGKGTHHATDSMVNEAALSSGADLTIRTHDGKKTQKRNVRVLPSCSTQNKVVMRLTKKCLGGFIVTTKECMQLTDHVNLLS